MRTKMEEWLSDEKWEGEYGPKIKTPRDWLREALKSALHNSKRPLGRKGWEYELAITMVPTFPEIVLEFEDGPEPTFTFDWERFEAVLDEVIDALLNQKLVEKE